MVDDAWRDAAACRTVGPAVLQVCAACPVIDDCRNWVLRHPEDHGVWGGWSEADRQGRPVRARTHGTRKSYIRHLERGERPCEACAEASRRYSRERYWKAKARREERRGA